VHGGRKERRRKRERCKPCDHQGVFKYFTERSSKYIGDLSRKALKKKRGGRGKRGIGNAQWRSLVTVIVTSRELTGPPAKKGGEKKKEKKRKEAADGTSRREKEGKREKEESPAP